MVYMKLSKIFDDFNTVVKKFYLDNNHVIETNTQLDYINQEWENSMRRVAIKRNSVIYRLESKPLNDNIPKYNLTDEEKVYLRNHQICFYIQLTNIRGKNIITKLFPRYSTNSVNANLAKDAFSIYAYDSIIELMENKENIEIDTNIKCDIFNIMLKTTNNLEV